MIDELKSVKLIEFDDMVYMKELAFNENIEILDKKYIVAATTVKTLPPARSDKSDLYLMLVSLIPNEVKVSLTNDDIGIGPNLKARSRFANLKFIEKKFINTKLGFT